VRVQVPPSSTIEKTKAKAWSLWFSPEPNVDFELRAANKNNSPQAPYFSYQYV